MNGNAASADILARDSSKASRDFGPNIAMPPQSSERF